MGCLFLFCFIIIFFLNCRSHLINCRAETRRASACGATIRCCCSGITSNPWGAQSLFAKRTGSAAWRTWWHDEKYCESSSVTFSQQSWGQFVMMATSLLHGSCLIDWLVFNMIMSSGLLLFLVIVLAVGYLIIQTDWTGLQIPAWTVIACTIFISYESIIWIDGPCLAFYWRCLKKIV